MSGKRELASFKTALWLECLEREPPSALLWKLIAIGERKQKKTHLEYADCYSAAESTEMGKGGVYCHIN